MATRINKYLSEIGHCSRRGADKLLEQGRITINGAVPELGEKVQEGDVVAVDGKVVGERTEKHVYIAVNKPRGIVCTTDRRVEKDNIVDFVGHPQRIFPIGRLDKPSEGLILMTSDGDVVTVHKPITQEFITRMRNGVPILDTVTRKCHVEQIGPKTFRIVLTQGLNRQIRRMSEYLDYRVTKLKRVRIMNIELDLPVGAWRDLKRHELQTLNRLCESSSKTHF
jgi:23S rRNA pseudouridine2604 synthase